MTGTISSKQVNFVKWITAWNFIREFISTSSIHGFNHFTARQRHPAEVVIWVFVVAVAIYGVVVLSSITLLRYIENPTVISMERDRFSWNTSFPSATICPHYKLNEPLLDMFISRTPLQNKTKFREFVVTLAEANYDNFENVVAYENFPSEEYLPLLLDLQFVFNPSVSNSGLTGKHYYLQKIVSEMGICYCFNSHMAVYNSPDYWDEGQWNLLPENETIFVNPLDGEVFANVINMSTGFDIYIHGPYEVADISSKKIASPNGYFIQIYLTGLTLFSSEQTRWLGINQRKCRFHDESNLSHSPVYSYVLCRMECRAALAKSLCGCVPHFYRKIDRLILLKGECSCLPNCDDTNFIFEDMDTREWFLGSNLQWGLKEYPKLRLKRDVIFGFSDLLVYIGGMAGLFLGCSFLSFIEIIYFFSLRLFCFVIRSRKDPSEKT